MPEPEDRYFESSRLRLHYAVWGDESKPALVLVHGGRDHARSWDFVAQRMLDRYAVYALDLRGHGDSDWAPGGAYPVSGHTGDMAALLDAIGRPSVQIVGHSLGGRVVLDFASAFPERVSKIVAIEGFGRVGSDRPPVERLRLYVQLLRELEGKRQRPYPTLEAAQQRMQEENQRLTPEMVRHLTEHAVRRREDGSYVWKFDNFVRLSPAPEWTQAETAQLWGNITAPTLHVGGAESWGKRFPDNRHELAKVVPNSRVVIFEDAGHWVHHDQLDGFVNLIRDFFD
jgi:pimeloyl-ACP methyl ester carboxylesterase